MASMVHCDCDKMIRQYEFITTEYAKMLEEVAIRQAFHYAFMIYALEQQGYDDVFTECFTYAGDTLFLWNIYEVTK